MSLVLVGSALGGIGLFLLGMRLLTEGLKVTAGAMLRKILARWTRTHFRGLCSGILITGVVQSSSAVTVATIGFVNAGVLTLGQAMWVIFGSNVGTTMTGWIVAIVGFDIKIEAFAMPLLGIGMFLTLTGTSTRRGALGEAIAGFGVFFLGIATLKSAFAGLGESIDLEGMVGGGVLNDALFVLAGFILTTLVQSSSAVIAIALTAAGGGILSIELGAALVIGANVGTTSTALLAVLGATPNAKRLAVSHVAFNVLTGATALALLPVMMFAVQLLEQTLSLEAGPTTTLALFHTVFNILGVLIIWPLTEHFERWLASRFVTAEENEGRPQFLDRNSLEIPALAANCVLLEMRRVADVSLDIARTALTDPSVSLERLRRRSEIIQRLNDEIVAYIQSLSMAKKSAAVAEAMAHPIRALWHFTEIAELALATASHRREIEALPEAHRKKIAAYAALIVAELDAARRSFTDPTLAGPDEAATESVYQQVKTVVLVAAANGEINAGEAETALETLSNMKTTLRYLNRASKRLGAVTALVHVDAPQPEERFNSEAPPVATP